MTSTNYDFIVVGGKSVSINSHNLTASVLVLTLVGGPCGSSLAARLSDAPSKPSVLMIEAGGLNEDPASRVAGERNTFWAAGGLELDYGYKTTPQAELNNRELSYHRGKGLGGSTATNLGVWDYGSNPELDEWARLVGDDCWKWENVQARYRKVTIHHTGLYTQCPSLTWSPRKDRKVPQLHARMLRAICQTEFSVSWYIRVSPAEWTKQTHGRTC